jgi:hypothetical protein
MSYGTVGIGVTSYMAARKATAWQTALACGAGHQIDFLSESIAPNISLLPDMSIRGSVQRLKGDKGTEIYGGSIESYLKYEGLGLFLAQCLGTAGAPTQLVNRTGADGEMNGSTAVLTSATAAFAAADVGKRITVTGVGSAGATLDTTILSIGGATTATLAASSATAASSQTWTIYDSSYEHTFKPLKDPTGVFSTIAIHKGVRVFEYPSVKIVGFKLSCKGNERAMITWTVACSNRNLNTSGGVNNTTTMLTVTLPANRDFANFAQLVVRANAASGGALSTATDALYLTEFEVEYMNNYAVDEVTTQYGYLIDEPVRNGEVTVKGSLVFGKYATHNQALMDAVIDKAVKKLDFKFTGPSTGTLMSATNPFSFAGYMPAVQFGGDDGALVAGPAKIGVKYEFEGHESLSVPTGFPALASDLLTVKAVNARSTNELA